MEVLHGDIRITLSDQDAIRGLERTRAQVKRQMAKIAREKAIIKVEGDLRELDKDLIQARRRLKKFEGMQAEVKLGLREGNFQKAIKEAQLQVKALDGRRIDLHVELEGQRKALAELKALQAQHHAAQVASEKYNDAVNKALATEQKAAQARGRMQSQAMRMDDERSRRAQANMQREGQMRVRAEREMQRDFTLRERETRKLAKMQDDAVEMDRRRGLEVANLRDQFDKANQALQRLQQTNNTITGRARRATHPEQQVKFDIDSAKLIGQMEIIRAKLKALNADPIDIHVDVKQSRALEKLLGVGDIGMRLGPFTGTLKQFTTAALLLGPILTGLIGSVTALAGAIGAGLTGAVGIAGAGLGGFALTLGGVGALTVSLFRDFKNLNTLQDTYHKQVLKTGANSEKAKVKLKEFNHALGEVTPTTRAAFMSLDELQNRWRGLRKQARPDFFNALGEAINTVNADFGLFSRETLKAFHVVSEGIQDWARGLRSAEAQNIMFVTMENTTDAIGNLLPALGHLGAAFGRVMASFSRHFGPLTQDFETWTASIDNATTHTGRLDRGVDRLVGSFRSSLGVITAFGRVIIEMTRAAMGPGGDLLDGIASGLNDIADSIHDNPKPLKDFFGDSINTTKELYGTLKPLLQLFMEFSTILRPATNALLSIIGPVAELVSSLAALAPIRAAFQAWATLWLFQRGTAMAVGVLAGSVNALALSFERLGKAKIAASLGGIAGGLRGGPAGGAVRPGVVAGYPSPAVMTGGGLRGAAVAPGGATGFGRVMGAAGRGLAALTTGLLGVSPPVAALGAVAVGAAIGISKMKKAAEERAAADRHAADVLGKDRAKMPNLRSFAAQLPAAPGRGGMPLPGNVQIEQWRKYRDTAVKAIDDVNRAIRDSGREQREMVGLGSQLQNARLQTEQAEKAYADAVKQSGKKSLEARMALQQLRDARTQESQATRQWAAVSEDAGNKVQRAVERAQKEFNIARAAGSPFARDLAKRLNDAKNSAAVFEINVRRAKKGLDIFTGEGSEKIGALVRQFGKIPGVKRTLVQVQTQDAAEKIAAVVKTLGALGLRKTVTHILANADNPRQALRELNAALDKWEHRHPVAELRADKKQAEQQLYNANKQLSMYGARKPEALLKARDEAMDKIKRLEAQLDHLNGKDATVTAHVKFSLPSDFATDAGSSNYAGSGDGEGVPDIKKAVKGFAERHGSKLSDMFLGGASGLGRMPAAGTGLNAFNRFAGRFGVAIGSGFRPGSITSSGNLSYHAMGRARDFPGPPANMRAFALFLAKTFGSRLKELIYSPLGWGIKNGRRVPNSYWGSSVVADHYDHVHVAMARGGRVTKPTTVTYGEEMGHPEYFISTNPRDRDRSWSLLAMAASELGGKSAGAKAFNRDAKGDGYGFAVGGQRADKGQASVIFQAIRIARALGAKGGRATQALLMAIMHESRARNLRGGDASSSGILQVLASTGRGMGINPRDKKAVIRAFLTRGFYGHGGAISLAKKNPHMSAAMIAHLVQGNATGTGVYRAEAGNARAALASFRRLVKSGKVKGSGAGMDDINLGGMRQPRYHGRTGTIAAQRAAAQGRLDFATGTGTYLDDIRALFGFNKLNAGRARHVGGAMSQGHGKTIRHIPGLIETVQAQSAAQAKRLQHVNAKLRGKLTPQRRRDLLSEKEQLLGSLAGNRTQVRDLREQGAEARFERRMRRHGPGALVDINARAARAESTGTLDDDIAAATAQQTYYRAREKWAKKRGNKEKATEARQAYNQATEQLRNLTNQKSEAWISFAENQAGLTVSLADDFKVASDTLAYWKTRVTEAQGRGDIAAAASAMGNVQQYTERVSNLREDMKRLPLERDAALAALTDDVEDDKKAAVALRDYWADRLTSAKKTGDLAGQIEAAGNLKSLNDEIKAAESNFATQVIQLGQARLDLYRQFGSNIMPTFPSGTKVGSNGQTIINMTVNGATLGDDAHTWSKNVAWELQAAV